jgi:hypothetical protein
MEWLSGSGWTASLFLNYCTILAERACARAEKPLSAEPVLGGQKCASLCAGRDYLNKAWL